MNMNSTDFACLVTGFLTDYLPHHRCYSKNTVLSYRDTLETCSCDFFKRRKKEFHRTPFISRTLNVRSSLNFWNGIGIVELVYQPQTKDWLH